MRNKESLKKDEDEYFAMLISEKEQNGFFSSSGQAFIRIPVK
ncbi:hypothetical protein [Methanococcoides alaskense]|uniref:Uncharacterized protein n=1 Tax=Methanococcoides alaskense TaxID=325778 RepID=A0AA90Z875_9EURY|nr:hypothetical protein [Methanococcoides alaskense]MDR6222606.1 hypothetical protein [Methanococcoides alaskense]